MQKIHHTRMDFPVNRMKQALLGGTLLVLPGSALAYGGMLAWVMGLTGFAIGLLVALWAGLTGSGVLATEIALRIMAVHSLAFFAITVWILLQIYLPTSASLVHPGWEFAATLIPTIGNGVISADPEGGMIALSRLLSYAGVFWLMLQLTRAPERADLMFHGICIIGVGLALIGLVNHLDGPKALPWLPDQSDQVRSTFINRNNFATYCGFTAIVALGLLIRAQDRQRQQVFRYLSNLELFARGMFRGGWFYLTVFIICFLALILSGSRAGTGATVAGIAVLVTLSMLPADSGKRTLGLLVPFLVVLGFGILAISGDFLTGRFVSDEFATNERFFAYSDVARALPDFSMTGVGFGAFSQGYPVYRGEDVGHVRFMLENTYLEMAFELGIPMALLWFGLLGSLLFRCFRGALQRRRNHIYPMVAASCGVLAAAHAALDYSLQIPAVALLFAAILGVGVAQSWPTRDA